MCFLRDLMYVCETGCLFKGAAQQRWCCSSLACEHGLRDACGGLPGLLRLRLRTSKAEVLRQARALIINQYRERLCQVWPARLGGNS